jgi:YVTN family beta-propeller protein
VTPEMTAVTNTIESVGSIPVGLAFTPDGTKAYVVNGGENRVRVIDTATETVDNTLIQVGSEPQEIAINAAGTRAYVTNFSDNTVSVIDLSTNTVIDTVTVGREPNGVAVRPDGAEVYVVNSDNEENTVSIIETSTNTVAQTLTREVDEGNIGLQPQKVAFSPDGERAYITNSLDFTVTIIDTATRDSINSLFVGVESFNDVINEPNGLFISPNGRRLYVALFGRNGQGRFLGVFSTATNRIQAFTEIGDGPIGVAVGGS